MSPQEIVEKYTKEEYGIIAITDHEVIEGIKPTEELGKKDNLRVIPGIELATVHKGIELHILGYYIDIENQHLKDEVEKLAEFRRIRNEKLLLTLQNMGYHIKEEDLIQRPEQTYIGKPNFARALIKKGYINTVAEAFEPGKFLESEEIKAIKREKPTTEDAIKLINEAGGIAVLAHPYRIKGLGERGSQQFKENFEELLRELKKAGLKGLECVYPRHTDEERLFFISLASKYHLHITEGSDFHGNR
jgi:hypothetical protein